MEQSPLPPVVAFRLRTVKIGIQATLLILAGLIAYPLLPGAAHFSRIAFYLVLLVALVGVGLISLLPWEQMFGTRWGLRTMYAWSAMDIVLITLEVVIVGPGSSTVFLYTLTTVFFGVASYPLGVQAGLLVFTFACYLLASAVGPGVAAATSVLNLMILITGSFLATFLSMELTRQIAGHSAAADESDRRASLLGTVARGARRIANLDSGLVLQEVVGDALALGFEAGNFCLFSEDLSTYRVVHARGLPASYVASEHPGTAGMPGRVLQARQTVVINDYRTMATAIPVLKEAGYRAVMATPVWSQGRLAAALVVGTKHEKVIGKEDVEAFELLAAHAGRALDNARMFEAERSMVERLHELDRLKSDFLASVSHELRTPLTVIQGMGITLERRWEVLDAEVRTELLRRSNANAKALHGIINSILDFSRLEEGNLAPHREVLDLGRLVRGTSRRFSPPSPDSVVVEVEEGLSVEADPELIGRVIENLVSNAIKHSPEDGKVHVNIHREERVAVVDITDEGPGIAVEDLDHMGEPFFRSGEVMTRSEKGIGLGLAFARGVLELHGSRLEVESVPGAGARFSFRLGLVQPRVGAGV